ncbi:MAG TPA: hypothetical protein VGR57_10805, partial [Ktedonobacterales bacterium]|nr:hypothetical protein [Ktedonobacterales bacterium]
SFGAPRQTPGGAWQARTRPVLAPPGRYRATVHLGCASATAGAVVVRVGVMALSPHASDAQEATARVTCGGVGLAQSATLTFISDGYHALAFSVTWPEATPLRAPLITYAPA